MERGHELRAESTRILDERLGTRVGERDGRMENFRRAEEEGGRIINDRAIIFITGEGMKGKGDFWKANAIRKDDWKGLLGRNFRSADTQGREKRSCWRFAKRTVQIFTRDRFATRARGKRRDRRVREKKARPRSRKRRGYYRRFPSSSPRVVPSGTKLA